MVEGEERLRQEERRQMGTEVALWLAANRTRGEMFEEQVDEWEGHEREIHDHDKWNEEEEHELEEEVEEEQEEVENEEEMKKFEEEGEGGVGIEQKEDEEDEEVEWRANVEERWNEETVRMMNLGRGGEGEALARGDTCADFSRNSIAEELKEGERNPRREPEEPVFRGSRRWNSGEGTHTSSKPLEKGSIEDPSKLDEPRPGASESTNSHGATQHDLFPAHSHHPSSTPPCSSSLVSTQSPSSNPFADPPTTCISNLPHAALLPHKASAPLAPVRTFISLACKIEAAKLRQRWIQKRIKKHVRSNLNTSSIARRSLSWASRPSPVPSSSPSPSPSSSLSLCQAGVVPEGGGGVGASLGMAKPSPPMHNFALFSCPPAVKAGLTSMEAGMKCTDEKVGVARAPKGAWDGIGCVPEGEEDAEEDGDDEEHFLGDGGEHASMRFFERMTRKDSFMQESCGRGGGGKEGREEVGRVKEGLVGGDVLGGIQIRRDAFGGTAVGTEKKEVERDERVRNMEDVTWRKTSSMAKSRVRAFHMPQSPQKEGMGDARGEIRASGIVGRKRTRESRVHDSLEQREKRNKGSGIWLQRWIQKGAFEEGGGEGRRTMGPVDRMGVGQHGSAGMAVRAEGMTLETAIDTPP